MVHLDSLSIDRCMDALHAAVLRDAELREELRASRPDFFPGGTGPIGRGIGAVAAERRHFEWFLVERSLSEPRRDRLESLLERCAESAGVDADAWRLSLERSHAGFFEVTSASERGTTLRDLADGAENAALAPRRLAEGDLIAGRLFPLEDGSVHVSPAAAVYRDEDLLAALRSDLERAREAAATGAQARARLRQSEIEAILRAGESGLAREAADGRGAVQRARAMLARSGLAEGEIGELLGLLSREAPDRTRILPGGGDALGGILDALAFETEVDLDEARAVLLDAWEELHADGGRPPAERRGRDVAGAIAEFDRRRSEGAPLERALADLERDLDLEPGGESDEPDEPALELPGVVGGVVEEFLWDEGRLHGEDRARRSASLRGLGRVAERISVFENLGRDELTEFACRWSIESGAVRGPEDAEELLGGLERFCRWSEENQDVPLHTVFSADLESLRESLPRLALANRAGAPREARPERAEWFELLERRAPGVAQVEDRAGRSGEVEIPPAVLDHLRPGDLVRAERSGGRDLLVEACYPAELGRLLRP